MCVRSGSSMRASGGNDLRPIRKTAVLSLQCIDVYERAKPERENEYSSTVDEQTFISEPAESPQHWGAASCRPSIGDARRENRGDFRERRPLNFAQQQFHEGSARARFL